MRRSTDVASVRSVASTIPTTSGLTGRGWAMVTHAEPISTAVPAAATTPTSVASRCDDTTRVVRRARTSEAPTITPSPPRIFAVRGFGVREEPFAREVVTAWWAGSPERVQELVVVLAARPVVGSPRRVLPTNARPRRALPGHAGPRRGIGGARPWR